MTLTGPPVMLSVSGLEALKILIVCGSFLRKFRIFSTVDCTVVELRASVAVMVTFLRSFHHILKFHFSEMYSPCCCSVSCADLSFSSLSRRTSKMWKNEDVMCARRESAIDGSDFHSFAHEASSCATVCSSVLTS